ncbi:ATP-binding cassette domain-containing protein [Pseudonocardia saturnea]
MTDPNGSASAAPRLATTARLVGAAAREVVAADRGGSAVALVLQLVGALAVLGVVGAGKLAFDALLAPETAGPVGVVPALLALALATALSGAASGLQTQQHRLLGEAVSLRIWDRLMDTTARAELLAYEATGFGTDLERVEQNALTRPFQVTTSLLGLVGGLVGVGALAGVLIAVEPLLVPLLLAAGLPAVLLSRWAGQTEFRFARRVLPAHRRRAYLRELLVRRSGAAELRAFDTAGPLRERHEALSAVVTHELRGQVRRRQLLAVATTLGVGLALGGALLAIVALVDAGRIGLADAGAAAIAARLLSGQLGAVFTAIGGLLESAPFLADLERFVGPARQQSPAPGRAQALRDRVELRGVCFTYPEQERPALDGVDLEIRAGEVVALVGENGSGKSTLARIVAGLYEPAAGSRHWDGAPLPAADVRASVGVVLQDFVRYQLTVRENIELGTGARPAGGAAVVRAATRAGVLAAGSDRALPQGLDTELGRDLDEGVDLSGGQWQRLALARALVRDSPLLVLDEPSAALDPRAEHELFADVRAVLDGRAALLVSHRFSSTRLADRIYVLADGRVVESGTHDELLARAGRYAELYGLQAAAYR